MKVSTREILAQFMDVEMVPDGLVERIHLLEKLSERCGTSIVPYQALLALCALYKVDAKGIDIPAEIRQSDIRPEAQDAPRFANPAEVKMEEVRMAKAVSELREENEERTRRAVEIAEKRREVMAKAREAKREKRELAAVEG